MKRIPRSLLLVGILAGGSCYAQSQAERTANHPSHRIIPRANPAAAPDYRKVMPAEIRDLWRRLEDADTQRPAEPRFRTMPEARPGFLAQDSTELLRELSEQAGRSMVEAMNTDITEFAQEANRRFMEHLQGSRAADEQPTPPSPDRDAPRGDPGQLAFDPSVDVDRNLQRLWSQVRDHQQEFEQLLRQYQQSWPSESVPPREWIQKVQPFINQELVRQLSDAAEQLRTKKSRASSSLGPRPSERNGSSSSSSPSGRTSEVHSNPVVASVLKAFDNQSTSLIKSATSRKRSGGRSWWKALQAKSKNKVRAFNRKFIENVREVATTRAERLPPRRDLVWSPRSPSTPAGFIALAFMLSGCLLAVWSLSGRRPWGDEQADEHIEEPPDPQTIQDHASLLTAFHALGWQLFGVRSRFWNHRQFFVQLKKVTELDGRSIEMLARMYERARYAGQGTPLSSEDLSTARRLFSSIMNRNVVSP